MSNLPTWAGAEIIRAEDEGYSDRDAEIARRIVSQYTSSKDAEIARLLGDLEGHERWLTEMCEDYRLQPDPYNASKRMVINQLIHALRAENERLREALEAMLSEFNEGMAGIVHDELAVIAKARQALRGESGDDR